MAAAIFVQQSGEQARVYERRKDVGGRFYGDFQGLENWSSDTDKNARNAKNTNQ